jgi:hypothetical protein
MLTAEESAALLDENEKLRAELDQLKRSPQGGEAIARLKQDNEWLESQLAALRSQGGQFCTGCQAAQTALGLVLGAVLATFSALIALKVWIDPQGAAPTLLHQLYQQWQPDSDRVWVLVLIGVLFVCAPALAVKARWTIKKLRYTLPWLEWRIYKAWIAYRDSKQ